MNNNTYRTYCEAVVNNFNFAKVASTIQEAYLRAIPIDKEGYLLPVCKLHLSDDELIQKLAAWKTLNIGQYSTTLEVTEECIRRYLEEKVLNVPDRMLYLVVQNTGKAIGHIGFANCLNEQCLFEIENVGRGITGVSKGIFSKALLTIINWTTKVLNVEGFYTRAMADDFKAIGFFERNSFRSYDQTRMEKTDHRGIVCNREAPVNKANEAKLVYLSHQPNRNVGDEMILTAGPSISSREAVYAYDAAANGWNKNWSGYLTRFEAAFAEYVGVKYALATSSCTGALQIALMSLGIEPGDEVIVPDETWVATANAVRYVGAVPVFADIELDTWNVDSNSVETLINHKTKAIICVHMYGHPARMSRLLDIARKHNLKLIEDAAPAIGAEWQGKRCGSFGDFAAFSFQGAKLLVTGEGGMLVTNDDKLYEKAKKIWDQGRNQSKTFWIDEHGVKFKMSNVQAGLGLAQLERADELIEMKRRLFSWYEQGLNENPFIRLNKEVPGARSIYWMSSLYLEEGASLTRDELMSKLRAKNIDTRPVFPAISQYPIWGTTQKPQPNAFKVGQRAMNLPSGVCLTKDEVMYVCRAINDSLR